MEALGTALTVELYNCNPYLLNDVQRVEHLLTEAALAAKATIVETVFHRFSPQGVSGVVVIAESHLAIHTWPEYGYAAIDIFTCGDTIDPWVACHHLKTTFQADHYEAREIQRGKFKKIRKFSLKAEMRSKNFTHKPLDKIGAT
ncbi:S-adenosylmethionine decarboxylase proenzyme [candidate division KSB3 bacterium]|uniref:S-adenosylmethionine decarboxylase proenzyme n=1 Tax=candidate division KSB3 bacterium TaxID=2044937 RepID=A0A9D5Q7N6_9BACT|nr:S-adenosylmethionine decarboxylase proenzyme [candidate division KSB3 bacterium]MBD3326101.1 S-adenosylmethionine decarboxylase proenzyme [candidate division KSB3 bacterium]